MTYNNKNFDYTNILGILALTVIGLTLHKKDSCKYQKKYIIQENKDFVNIANKENAAFVVKKDLTFGSFRSNVVLITGTKESLVGDLELDPENMRTKLYDPNFFNNTNPVEKNVLVGEKFDWINDPDFKAGKNLLIRDANITRNFNQKKLNNFAISNYASFDKEKQYVYNSLGREIQNYFDGSNPVIFVRLANDNVNKTFLRDNIDGDVIYQNGTIFNV